MNGSSNFGALVGRILLALIFVLSGLTKITSFAATAGYMHSAGIPGNLVTLALIITILIELGCGLLIMLGLRARFAASIIFLWLIPVTFVFHYIPFHNATAASEAMTRTINMIMILKNLSMMGGLLLLASLGPGPISFDGSRTVEPLESRRQVA